jgi:integrase/recombinase XerC
MLITKELVQRLVAAELSGNRVSRGYAEEVRYNLGVFFTWLGPGDIGLVDKPELLAYYAYVCTTKAEKGVKIPGSLISRRTINGRLGALRKAFKVLYQSEYLDKNPFDELVLGVRPERGTKRQPFSEKEMAVFLDGIKPTAGRGLRDRTLFELMYSSGLRAAETAKLSIGDVDLEQRELLVQGKGAQDRVVPFSRPARDFLTLYLKDRTNRLEPVFLRANYQTGPMLAQTITRRFRTLLQQFDMGGTNRLTHAIRHSTATHLLDNGAGIRHVQELLGHKNIENTVLYTHLQTGGLAKIHQKYHPREHRYLKYIDEDYIRRLDFLLAKAGNPVLK